ncbi:MAG TPA: hypothetical protein VJV05_10295 [Pyrinomonadaceae bacterium]|nr:hypothetical protein [Pyrinomonadaceae bacterium]
MKQLSAFILILSFAAHAFPSTGAVHSFDNIELLQSEAEKVRETSVRVEFGDETMRIVSRSNGTVLKEWPYTTVKSAEYSYTKNPRWKTGLGLGAAAIAFPLLLIVAIPIGFTKHRRHWVTIRTENDYAVLKVGKGVRKIFMPAFETKTSVLIDALGDDK